MASYLFTNCHEDAGHTYPHLLSLILAHPSFKSRVNAFMQLFSSKVTSQGLIHMGQLIYSVLLPDFPQEHRRKLAQELFESLQTHPDEITYTNLSQYLLRICSDTVENIDVRSTIGFLDMIEARIIDHYVIDIEDAGYKEKIQQSVKLELFDSEAIIVDCKLPENKHRVASELIYYEQKFQLSDNNETKPTQVLIRQLKQNSQEVIPLGFVYEQFCFDYINSNFEMKNSYRLQSNKSVRIDKKIDYWVTINQNCSNCIRDNVVNQEIFKSCAVLSGEHLPSVIEPPQKVEVSIYRINSYFCKPNYYQKLKQLSSGDNKHFNIVSEFYDRNEFNIDELNLTREKLIVRRKEQLLDITGKETVKKEVKDFDAEVRNMCEKISWNKSQYLDLNRMEENIKDLSSSLRSVLSQDKNINHILNKHLSASEKLPRDSQHPFKQDIINLAHIQPLQILMLGRAKSGKSTLAKAIAKQYNLVYVSVESMIEKVLERSAFFKQNPPEPDEDGNIKGGLLKIEECILLDLEQGKEVEEEDILDLINIELKKQYTKSRGYILDLPIEYSSFWSKCIMSNKLYTPKIGCRFFNRIVEIQQTEEEWAHFTKTIMQKPEDLQISSSYDRYLITKPKPPPEDGEDDQQGDDAQKPTPLLESNLIRITGQESILPIIEHVTAQMNPFHYIKVQNSYQTTEECLHSISLSLYKIPIAKKIEGNEKELLTVGLDEVKITRKWSPWGLVDPVELHNGKLLNGKFQFAAEYAGRVFVFENQNNQNAFIQNPRTYILRSPQLPNKTNIIINGPRKSGKRTLAKLLSQIYGWKVIDIEGILKEVMIKQKSLQSHVPSNPDRTSRAVHLSEPQFKDFYKGNMINAKDVLPIILFELGIALQKKPPGWGIEKTDEEGGQDAVEEKKPAPKKPKKKQKKDEDERPKTPPLEDIALKEIIPKINHFGKLDEIKGFIIIGYPNNEEQLAALKAFNIPIDKMILLSDASEEAPNKTLATRLNDAELEMVGTFSTNIAPVKEALGEQTCRELNINQTPEELINKIRQFIDPFYEKCDEDNLNRVCADKQQDGDPIPMGYCGDHCPIILNQGWLMRGKEDFENGFEGKRFKFSGEKQLNMFKQNPTKYLSKDKLIVPPRVMFMGIRGVGLKTQLKRFNQLYKIPIIGLKDTILQHIQNEKNKRKTERYYNKGFKVPEFDEEGKQIEDPELNEEAADFDKGAVQVETVKKIFNGINQIFINGNFFDIDEEAVSTPIVDLLAQARRLPEVVFMLSCNENKWLERVLDKKEIQKELEEIKQKRREEKRKQREEARQKAIEDGEEYQQPAEDEEQDPQIPKLQDLIAQKEQTLKQQRESDQGKLEQLEAAFESWNVKVIKIPCERDQKHVTDKINTSLKPYLDDRVNRWQRNNMLPIERYRVPDFINNYSALQSRFGNLNPFNFMKPLLSYPLIYNDRIYYLKDEEEREKVMRDPKILQTNEPVPNDVRIVPKISIIGQTKTGKTTLAESLSKKLGMVLITIDGIVSEFCQEHKDAKIEEVLNHLKSGQPLTDEMMVDLIAKRVSLSDCQKNGWILDNFPMNKNQCNLLNRHGLLPKNVFSMKLTEIQIKKRVLAKVKKQEVPDYDYDMEVIDERIKANEKNLLEVEVYFATQYNNIRMLDGKVSKWGLFEEARKHIESKIKARKDLVRSMVTHSAAAVSDVGLHYNCIINNLSSFGNWCPISFKIRRQYVKRCPRHHKNLAIYNKKIYHLSTQKELNDFLNNPQVYEKKTSSFMPPLPVSELQIFEALKKAENKAYCMVELGRKKLEKGNSSYTLKYKNKYFVLSTPKNMKMFIKNPVMYELAKLQDKLPVEFEKKSDLKKIAKKNDCTAFLEHHLSNIMMRSLAQLGYRRPKYPTLGSKESALKFLSISLKANNPNKDDEYRQKYREHLNRFIKECNYSQEIRDELDRKSKGKWQQYDEQNLLKLSEQYNEFLKELNATDKVKYFSEFIR